MLAGLVAGLLPGLWVARRVDVTTVLNEDGSQARGGSGGRRLHRGLLVTEVALATLLLVGAGALIRTVVDLTRVDPGFHNDRILTVRLQFGNALRRPDSQTFSAIFEQNQAVFDDLRRRVEALPEVVSAGLAQSLPLVGNDLETPFIAEDHPEPVSTADLPATYTTPAGAGYFDTMGIPLVEGRYINDTDRPGGSRVVVVTETLARRLWPTESALGKRVKLGQPDTQGPWREIVGVVGAVRQDGLDAEPRSQTFLPHDWPVFLGIALVAQTTGDPLRVVGPVRAAVKAAHPDLVAYDFRSMDDIVATQMAPRRFVMWTLVAFGLIAIVVAAVGIYGILAHAVAQRLHEFGIRMALGAERRNIRALVVREGVWTAIAGVLVGVVGSLAALRITRD